MSLFEDRHDAGRRLAERLAEDHADADVVVLGMPRGGVPVAFEVAQKLGAPLDVVVVRKVGAPHNPEYGVGAVGEEDVVILNDHAVAALGLTRADLEETIAAEQRELDRRLDRYRSGRPAVDVRGRTAIVVDDGLATGVSATAAVQVLRERGPQRVVLAVPVGASDSVERLRRDTDDVVCLHTPASFMAVGSWYRNFEQTTDETVVELLGRAHEGAAR